MARAQAIETFEKERRRLVKRNGEVTSADAGAVGKASGITIGDESEDLRTESCIKGTDRGASIVADVSDSPAGSDFDLSSSRSVEVDLQQDSFPDFHIRLSRKFEPTELCEMFFGWWMKLLYLLILLCYNFLGFWANSTVAGSAWATNIPFHFGGLDQCGSDAFHLELIPKEVGCRNTYRFCMMIFAVIVVSLSMLNLKEQAFVQVILGFMRFAMFICMILYVIVNLAEGGNACIGTETYNNGTNPTNSSKNWTSMANRTGTFKPDSDFLAAFDWKGWVISVPVFSYAFIIHQAIPTIAHSIRPKKSLHWLMASVFAVTLLLYLSLAVTIPLWFQGSIQENSSLNWASLSKPGNHPALRALSYYIVLFPSVDVTSAYPLGAHAIANNVYTILLGRDTTKKKYRFDWTIQLLLRFIVALLPAVAAMFLSNLIYVLKYAGLLGLSICFFFPVALQLQSQRVCSKLFGAPYYPTSLRESSGVNGTQSRYGSTNVVRGCESTPLLSSVRTTGKELYMTPYSFNLFSRRFVVALLGLLGVGLFGISVIGLFELPDAVTCQAVH